MIFGFDIRLDVVLFELSTSHSIGIWARRCIWILLLSVDFNLHQEYVVEFDFLGKDSMRYQNVVEVNKKVFKNLAIFKENKVGGDQLFDRLDTGALNAYLKKLMPGLTAKVFRTYNASTTLEAELQRLTVPGESVDNLIVS